MKRILFLAMLFAGMVNTFAQVGINTNTPHLSTDLELASTNKALLLNRVDLGLNPTLSDGVVDGMIVYDTSSQCVRVYEDGAWSNCVDGKSVIHASYCEGAPTMVIGVISGSGRTWMDRNLGASQAATSLTDEEAYGSLYQWGRFSDGHQCRNSVTTTDLSVSDVPGHNKFILPSSAPYDWRASQNYNLWQGYNGVNNPCPSGYRIPTYAELAVERTTWNTYDAFGAFNSALKIPLAGIRGYFDPNNVLGEGTLTFFWASTLDFGDAAGLVINTGGSFGTKIDKANGLSVRCIKEEGNDMTGSVGHLSCDSVDKQGVLTAGMAASGVTLEIPYPGGNGGVHYGQTTDSYGVTGLTATLAPGTFNFGAGTLIYDITGTPDSAGIAYFDIVIGGEYCTIVWTVGN